MERLWSFPTFILVCILISFSWNAIGGAYAQAPAPNPAPSPAPKPPPSVPEIPRYYLPFEAEAIYSMLRSWNNSATNTSALMPRWSLNYTHPCNYTWGNMSRWFSCYDSIVNIGNLTGKGYTVSTMQVSIINRAGGVELVGELPAAILNLTSLEYLRIDEHPRLSGPIPPGLLKAFPLMKSLSLTRSNLSGSIIVPPESRFISIDLNILDLSGNFFTGSLPFCQIGAKNFTVRSLNLSTNRFSGTFCTDDLTTLELLDISNNQFTDVNISYLRQSTDVFPLKTIYARHNLLQRFPNQLLQLPRLQEIYLDSNIISGILTLPFVSHTNSSLRLISLVNNNITNLEPSIESSSLLSESNLRISDFLLFLGGNPICKDSRKHEMLRMVCRFNRSSPIEDPYHEASKMPIIISACISAVVLVALVVTLFVIKRLMKKISALHKIQMELDKKDVKPNLYSYTELKAATQDFHPNNELGRGGFGVVYKGVLVDGSKVAVKRLLKANKEQDIQDFLNEIIVISNIKHRNLVQLKGCCIRGDQRILVYELVDNKNLATTLSGDYNEGNLDWGTRFNIILGIARGLAYLHEEVEPSIIHRDIKGSNILLDKDLNPKIADFGLALFFPSLDDGETHMSVSKIAGTMGYLSPEYAIYGQVSTKLDVFSFGVLVLEIVSGRKNIDYKLPSSQQCLIPWAQRLHANSQVIDLVDKSFQEVTMTEKTTMKKVVEVGLLCLHHLPAKRPSMSEVVAMLIGNKEIDCVSLNECQQTYAQRVDIASSSIPSMESWKLSQVDKVFLEKGDDSISASLPSMESSLNLSRRQEVLLGQEDIRIHRTSPLLKESWSFNK